MKRGIEPRFSQLTNQVIGGSPKLPNLYQQLEMVGCTNEDHPYLSQES